LSAALTSTVSKVYDATTGTTIQPGQIALSGFVAGQGATVAGTSGSFASANAGMGVAISAALPGSLVAPTANTALSNYIIPSSVTGVGNINPAQLALGVTSAVSKVYDGTTTASLNSSNAALFGFVSGQGGTLTGATATFASANVGSGLAINGPVTGVAAVAAPGTNLANYLLPTTLTSNPNVGNTGSITPRALTATLTGTVGKIYDATTDATIRSGQVQLGNFVAGEGATVTSVSGSFGAAAVGTNVVVNVTGFGSNNLEAAANTSLSNYIVPTNFFGLIGSITQRPVTASLRGGISRVYDGSLTATLTQSNLALAGVLPVDMVAVQSSLVGLFDTRDVGVAKAVTLADLTLTGTGAGNYRLNSTTVSAPIGTITQRALTAALTGPVTKVFDGTVAAPIAPGNLSVAGFVFGEDATIGPVTGTFASRNVGNGLAVTANLGRGSLIAAPGTLLSNYSLADGVTASVGTITPATLLYIADAATRAVQSANPAFSGRVEGFVTGDTQANATTGTLAFTTTATNESPVGRYAINGGGLAAQNYAFVQAASNATALAITGVSQAVTNVTRPSTITAAITSGINTPTVTSPPPPPQVQQPQPQQPQRPPQEQQQGEQQGQPQQQQGQQQQSQQGGQQQGQQAGPAPAATPVPPPLPPAAPPPPPTDTGSPPQQQQQQRQTVQVDVPPPAPALPPSPVTNTAPPTPQDSANTGDTVLAAAVEPPPSEPPSEQRQAAPTQAVANGINVVLPTGTNGGGGTTAGNSFSSTGDLGL
jgi:YDG domain/MBG domain (YGX type)